MATERARCSGTNKRGLPCGSRPVEDGKCLVHLGRIDMKALGAAGGRASVVSRLGIKNADATPDLREKAKTELERMLVNPDTSDSVKAGIAKALYAYAPQQAPGDRGELQQEYSGASERLVSRLNRMVERARETGVAGLSSKEQVERLMRMLDELQALLAANKSTVEHQRRLTLADVAAFHEKLTATGAVVSDVKASALEAENEQLRRRVHELEVDGGRTVGFSDATDVQPFRSIAATSTADAVVPEVAAVVDELDSGATWPPADPSGMASDAGLWRSSSPESS